MTSINKKFEEKRLEEIKKVEDRFDAILKQGVDYEYKKEDEQPQNQEEEKND